MHLCHHLEDLCPIRGLNACEHLVFATLDVDLQQVNAFNALGIDDLGDRSQFTWEILPSEAVVEEGLERVGG